LDQLVSIDVFLIGSLVMVVKIVAFTAHSLWRCAKNQPRWFILYTLGHFCIEVLFTECWIEI